MLPAKDHTRLIWTCVLWAICALGALGLGIPFRAISTKLDLTISNRLRSRLFERLLRQGPEFYHTHDPGELNAVANQFTIEAAMTLRQIAVDMLLQMAVLGGTVALLIYNFQMKGPPPIIFGFVIPPPLIPLAIVLFAFISPYLTGRMANRVRNVSSDMQEKMLALNSLVTGAMQSPEEIQTMEAEPIFAEKHDAQLEALLRSRLKSTFTIESVNLVNGLPSWFIQVVMLAFGVFVAIRSGNAESAGNVVAIFLLTPLLMSPIGSLSAYIVMAGSAWPRIETVNKMLESRASRDESSGTVKVESVPPTLVAENITFSYKPDSRRIFEGRLLRVASGKNHRLRGEDGAGEDDVFQARAPLLRSAARPGAPRGKAGEGLCGRQSLRSHRDDVAIPRVLSRYPPGQHEDGQARCDRRGDPRHLRGDRSLESFAGWSERQSAGCRIRGRPTSLWRPEKIAGSNPLPAPQSRGSLSR